MISTSPNNIPMVIDGDPRLVQPGVNNSDVNYFDLLKTLEGYYGLAPTGLAATADGLPSNGGRQIDQTAGRGGRSRRGQPYRRYCAPTQLHGVLVCRIKRWPWRNVDQRSSTRGQPAAPHHAAPRLIAGFGPPDTRRLQSATRDSCGNSSASAADACGAHSG